MKIDYTYRDVPVSIFFSIVIIIIFLLYTTSLVKTIPCGDTILQQFYSNFIHTDLYHILSNLYSIYALARVEKRIGIKKFLTLIIFLLVTNTIFETIAKKLKPELPCSIGFSGVLFGIMAWEIVSEKDLDPYILSAIGIMIAGPSIKNSDVSLLSHSIGAFSGIIGGLLYRYFQLLEKKN